MKRIKSDAIAVEPERRQWGAWNFVGFWIADSFNIVGPLAQLDPGLLANQFVEYMDDLVLHDCQRSFLVAVVARCLDRLLHRWYFHLYDWTHWSHLPHLFPRCQQSVLWYLGFAVACVQPSCDGLYLVWCAVLDWRYDIPSLISEDNMSNAHIIAQANVSPL